MRTTNIKIIKYAFRDSLPALAGVAATSGSYAWKRNTLLSILCGTVVFMVLIRII